VGFGCGSYIDPLITPHDLYDGLEQPDVVESIHDAIGERLVAVRESVCLTQPESSLEACHAGSHHDDLGHGLILRSIDYWTLAQRRYPIGMKRMTPETRRQAIVEAAHAVAVRKGLAATTVRDVAKEMDTSSGLIHHYFESMDQLLTIVFENVAVADLEATRAAMDRAESPTQRLSAYFAAFVDPRNDEVHQLWLDAWSAAGRNETLRETSRALNIEWQRLLSDAIRSGIETGEFEMVDAEEVSWKTLSLLDGLSLQLIAHPTVLERGVAASWAANSMELDLGLPQGALSTSLALT
jgi:AcrR family transcriptional regulator